VQASRAMRHSPYRVKCGIVPHHHKVTCGTVPRYLMVTWHYAISLNLIFKKKIIKLQKKKGT
jgi:hypothetical protein